jgi:hypothetical protein
MRKLLTIAVVLVVLAAVALRYERARHLAVEASSAPSGETAHAGDTSHSSPDASGFDAPANGNADFAAGGAPGGARDSSPGELPPDWQPAPGESMAQVIEAHLLQGSSMLPQETNTFVSSEVFDSALARLSRDADPKLRKASGDNRARVEAVLRKDPRFTVEKFACSARLCLATIAARRLPKADDFENMFLTSPGKPRFYAAVIAPSDPLNANQDRQVRMLFATDPALNSFIVDPSGQDPSQADAGSNTR